MRSRQAREWDKDGLDLYSLWCLRTVKDCGPIHSTAIKEIVEKEAGNQATITTHFRRLWEMETGDPEQGHPLLIRRLSPEEIGQIGGDPRRVYYQITDAGEHALVAEHARLREFIARELSRLQDYISLLNLLDQNAGVERASKGWVGREEGRKAHSIPRNSAGGRTL